MLRIASLIFALLVSWSACAQVPLTGAGKGAPGGAIFQGPGNIVSGALIWGSCARVYNTSLASTATSLCDLVDKTTGTVAICTLRGSASGFVDLTGSYCTGSATPAVACAAAAGGACNVSKIYDQIGGTSGWINATNSQRPALTFSSINSLPGWTCTSAANSNLATTTAFTQAAPYTYVAVAKRTSNFTTEQALVGWASSPNSSLTFAPATNSVRVTADAANFVTLGSVTDGSFHAIQGVVDASTSGVIAVDGTEASGTTGTVGPSASLMRVCRVAGGLSLDGTEMEAGFWPSAISPSNRPLLNTNTHGAFGYNF